MLIYIITASFTFLALLFWAKWVNVSEELKNAKESHIKSELEKTKEIKNLIIFMRRLEK